MRPAIRNEHLIQVHPIRNLLRGDHPDPLLATKSGVEGLTIQDLDLVVKFWGPMFRNNDTGRFRFIEFKHGKSDMSTAQHKTFADLDYMLSMWPDFYDGFFRVNYDHTDVETVDVKGKPMQFPAETVRFMVTGLDTVEMDRVEFIRWMQQAHSTFPGMGQSKYWRKLVMDMHSSDTTTGREDLAFSHLEQMIAQTDVTIADIAAAFRKLRWSYP